MHEPKPIEYIQSVLYHLKIHRKWISLAVLIIATIIMLLLYASTENNLWSYIGLVTLLCAIVTGCVIAEPYVTQVLDTMGFFDVPEDEEG